MAAVTTATPERIRTQVRRKMWHEGNRAAMYTFWIWPLYIIGFRLIDTVNPVWLLLVMALAWAGVTYISCFLLQDRYRELCRDYVAACLLDLHSFIDAWQDVAELAGDSRRLVRNCRSIAHVLADFLAWPSRNLRGGAELAQAGAVADRAYRAYLYACKIHGVTPYPCRWLGSEIALGAGMFASACIGAIVMNHFYPAVAPPRLMAGDILYLVLCTFLLFALSLGSARRFGSREAFSADDAMLGLLVRSEHYRQQLREPAGGQVR